MSLKLFLWINLWKKPNSFTSSHTSKNMYLIPINYKTSVLYKTSLLLLLIIAKKNPKNQNKKTEHFWKCTLFLRICPTTSTSETSVNIFSLLSFHCLFLLEYVFIYSVSLMKQGNYNFLGCSGNPSFKQKISTKVI